MPAVSASLVMVLVAAQVGPSGPDSVVWMAARAVSGDSAAALATTWNRRIVEDPTDPAASLGLAALAFYSFDYDQALSRYQQLVDSPGGPNAWTVRAQLGIGHVLHRRADLPAADSAYTSAARNAGETTDSTALADALINLALVRARTQGLNVALGLFDRAADVLQGANDRVRAMHRCARGVFVGNEALINARELDEGARIAANAGEPSLQATCMFGRAAIHMLHGVTDSVVDVLDRVIELQRSANDRYGLAGVLQRRSWYQRALGDYAGASELLAEALEHAAVAENASAEAWASIDLASISLALRDHVSTVQYAQRAEDLFAQQNDAWGQATAGTIRARLSMADGHLDEARDFYDRAVEAQMGVGDVLSAVGAHQQLAEIALRQGDLDTAAGHLEAARALAESGRLTGWERGLRSHEARLMIARGNLVEARDVLDGLLRTPHQPARRYELRVLRALASALSGDLDAAGTEMFEAGTDLDTWRSSLDDRQLRIQAFQPMEVSAGAATVIAALARDGRLETAVRLAEQRRARELFERIVLTRAIGPEAGAAAPAPSDELPDFASWRLTFGPTTALLYYVTGDDEPTTLVLVTPDTAFARVLPPVDSMAGAIDRFRGLAASEADSRSASALLSDLILEDILDDGALAEADRLVIVPDGALHRVPFAALVLDDGRYLVERFAIASAPSVTVAMQLAGRPANNDRPANVLALGDPEFRTVETARPGRAVFEASFADAEALPRLAASGREARRVARYASASRVRTGADASEAWLRSEPLGQYNVIHFATHALVDEQSFTRTALVLSPGGGDDGFLGSAELSSLSLAADLVVLSACRSAGGVVLRGEGIHGLTAPLLEAGARSIVATQWRIEDAAVGPLVDDLYSSLADGLDVAAALRAAQRASIARGEPTALWAAFALVGDPGVTLMLRRPGFLSDPALVLLVGGLIGVMLVGRSLSRRSRDVSAE